MSAAALGWVLFALSAAIGAFLFTRARAADQARAVAAALLGERDQELADTQKRLEQRAAELRARGEEISELRKKHEKLKRRAGEDREEEKGAPARIRTLEADLAAERADSRAARDEIVRLHAEVARVTADLAHTSDELTRAGARVAELAPLAARPGLDEVERRAEASTAKLGKLTAELENAHRDAAKFKGRWETLDKAYIVLRGELELKKDEMRTQRAELERLRALSVVLVEPEQPSPEPG